MTTFGGLAKKLRKASVAVSRNADQLVKDVAEAVLLNVVSDTPVDKGDARSNWQVKLDSPADGIRDAYVSGKKGSTGLENIIASAEMGNKKIQEYAAGQEIHITNNLDYISDLNNGASTQAPPGYVQNAVIESIGLIQRAGFTIMHDIGN